MENYMKKTVSFIYRLAIACLILVLGYSNVFATDNETTDNQTITEHILPPPRNVDTILEESISMRKSHRIFTDDPVTDEELSTVLWAAYGIRADGKRTVAAIDGVHAAIIYVLKEDAAFKYNPENHSLVFYAEGDHRLSFQEYPNIYMAPIQLLLGWDTDKAEPFPAAVELGEIGQNIQLMSVSIGLGSVVTAQLAPAEGRLELPQNEWQMVMMPLGHLKTPYRFFYQPNRLSLLDPVAYSEMSLSTALKERNEVPTLGGTLSGQEKSQILWAAYGFSPLLDKQLNFIYLPRHRTVPNPHYAYDAVIMYVVTQDGIYRYSVFCNLMIPGQPVVDFLIKVLDGDKRKDISQACIQPSIASAPLSILSVLDIEKALAALDIERSVPAEYYWPYLYYVAGASAHNILLEATALNLSGNITYPQDPTSVLSILGLSEEAYQPLLVMSVGSGK